MQTSHVFAFRLPCTTWLKNVVGLCVHAQVARRLLPLRMSGFRPTSTAGEWAQLRGGGMQHAYVQANHTSLSWIGLPPRDLMRDARKMYGCRVMYWNNVSPPCTRISCVCILIIVQRMVGQCCWLVGPQDNILTATFSQTMMYHSTVTPSSGPYVAMLPSIHTNTTSLIGMLIC